jgi:uracil-DNA glycosylase family 4
MRDKEHLKEQILGHLRLYEDMGVCWIGSPAAIDTPQKPAGISSPVSEGGPMEAIEKTRAYSSLFDQVPSVSESLDTIREDLGDCRRCKLAANRMNIVFGSGNPQAELMFVGEAPGAEEDQQGLPFVGRAGQLLTKIIEAIEMSREDVYICNILKCRPPGNRNPEDDEISACEPFLFRQIASVKPRVICALGAFGAQTLLKTRTPISRLRGHLIDYRGTKFMATFHPAYLLRNPNEKRKVWEDVQVIQRYLRSLGSSSKS